MVQLLSVVLDIPLHDRNRILLAAGYAPAYGERELTAPDLQHVRRALDFILRQQEPYPALVVDAEWNVTMSNAGAKAAFGQFFDSTDKARTAMRNAVRTVFDPSGLRPFITNWHEFAGSLIQRVHAEANSIGGPATQLRDSILDYPDVPTGWKAHDPMMPVEPLLTLRLRKGPISLAYFSTITTFAAPFDVTLQQLRIECFHPADSQTERASKALGAKNRSK